MAAKASVKDVYHGTGRRKTSVARVRVSPGEGKIRINKRDLKEYFCHEAQWEAVYAPLQAAGCASDVDVSVRVMGGGSTGQSGAVSLGLARALVKFNADFEETLRSNKLMTRDSRRKERKKYGLAGARRSFQFSKR